MTAIASRSLVSVADYLAGEESAECRHEFLDGEVSFPRNFVFHVRQARIA